MCKHDPNRLSCQLCISEWNVKSTMMSERGKKGILHRGEYRPYAGRRRCRECRKYTDEVRCSDCGFQTRKLPVMARHRIHYVNDNVDSLPKHAHRYSYTRGEAFCKHCGILVKKEDTYRMLKATHHKECGQQIRVRPLNSNRPEYLKRRGDAQPK